MRTLVVDDHALFSEGLRLLLMAAVPTIDVVCCDSGAEATRLAAEIAFELVLLDWNLGSGLAGLEVLQRIKQLLPASRVVVVSGDCDAGLVRRAIDAGAVGFVPKESSPALLIDALTVSAHGGIYLPKSVLSGPESADSIGGVRNRAGSSDLKDVRALYPRLTSRHVDVLTLIVRGMPNKQIARELGISDGTVKQHVNAIFRELKVENRTEAVYLLARGGFRFE